MLSTGPTPSSFIIKSCNLNNFLDPETMSPLHVRSKVCRAPFHVRSKVYKFAPHMDGSNKDFVAHIEGGHADFAQHTKTKYSENFQFLSIKKKV